MPGETMDKLIVFDMDGVLYEIHNFWMQLHKVFDTYEKGKKLTDKYLLKDYNKLIDKVVENLWKGKPAEPYFELINSAKKYEGVSETFKELKKRGYIIAIITCGPKELMEKFKSYYKYGYCNELVIKNNFVKGEFKFPVAEGRINKVKIVMEIANREKIDLKDITAVADGKSDLDMLNSVGKAIAFNPTSKEIEEIADHVVNSKNLKEILKFCK